ncbi:MAG: preprotein translocase subunit SecE [Rhodobacteraceae bacterium]|jgi:preprotein translocase subunit SecE|nr:MAG: preprotein translocase subunit SecE [Paracoccaceae bacterium]
MNAKSDISTESSVLDKVKIVLAIAIVVGGVAGYYIYEAAPAVLRIASVIFSLAIALGVFATTGVGRELWRFIQGSRIELRKVVWPNRQETGQTTLVIIFFVIIMGIFFWLLDMFLVWAVKLLTGQGG